MTLRSRLALGLLAIAILLVLPVAVALRALERSHDEARALRDGEFAASLLLGRLREGLSDLRQRETSLILAPSEQTSAQTNEAVRLVARLADSLGRRALPDAAREIRSAVDEIAARTPEEYRAALAGQTGVADSISTRHVGPALARAERVVALAERSLRGRTQDRIGATATALSAARRLSLLAGVLALAAAALIAVWLTRSIDRPVRQLERGMRAVADGELDYPIGPLARRQDEFGRLGASFESMTRQLTELDKLKAEFVSIASHELKTPLNVILGYLALLQEGVYGPVSEKQREVHATIEQQANTLSRLVKQLLDVSRFEAGGGKLEPRPVAVAEFFEDLERAFQVLAMQRGVTLSVAIGDEVPAKVVWDVDRVNEVLGNLLANAFKFTNRGGRVDVLVSAVGKDVVVEVRDTGAGIPPAQLPHIFEKFYQAANQASAAHGGSGLGLAISKQIVEAHRGTITCESTPGVGTTFTITLPSHVEGGRLSTPRFVQVVTS